MCWAVYDDRLAVMLTGPLHFGRTPENLFGPHESRPGIGWSLASSTATAFSRSGAAVHSGWRN